MRLHLGSLIIDMCDGLESPTARAKVLAWRPAFFDEFRSLHPLPAVLGKATAVDGVTKLLSSGGVVFTCVC